MATAYDPSQVEEQLYAWWEQSGFFRPSGGDAGGEPFTIIMPPPNLTGELHVGHALTDAVEDILIRWHRMRGDDTLWLPGVDHAAIAVNALVERELAKEGLTRHDLGREGFLDRVWQFVRRSRSRVSEQHRRLGASADWSSEVFTMDEGPQLAVRTTFTNLYEDGLIYRGEYLINWCPACETALSDLEVDHEDEAGSFWHLRYPLVDDEGKPTGEHIVVATTRPETIPADTAIAVHPDDERYAHLIGRHVQVPTTARTVPLIADEAVSIEGGSGALKVTPGHDPVDFEIGQRHDLPIISIIATDGTMNEASGSYAGLDRFVARDRVVEDLDAAGQLERVEDYAHPVGHCQRSGDIVEPLISEQWFVRMQPLAERGIEVVKDGSLRFVPARFERTYMQWLENIRDWVISRQIWWGHRIPAWYCGDCDGVTVAVEDPTECSACRGTGLRQDEDTLDTWFSSGLWPHSTLGWPERTEALDRYYPTQVMETGYDIIFFWVARMVMLSLYNTDRVPFDTVYLHGMVRASDGQKMSKSKGNVTDPLDAIATYGTDALRYTLVAGSSPGNDQRLSDQRLEAGRNFANKLWNASRFVLTSLEAGDDLAAPSAGSLAAAEDRWILSRTERLVADYDDLMGRFELAEAARQVRDFFWDEYADWYIELAKIRMRAGDRTPAPVLVHVLDRLLRLLHPVMPYVSEEIWQRLTAVRPDPDGAPALIVARFPEADSTLEDPETERELEAVQDFVRAVRNIRAEKQVDAGHWVEAYVVADGVAETARSLAPAIEALARVRPLHIVDAAADAPSEESVTSVLPVGRVVLPMAGLFDLDTERERLGKQIEEAKADVARIEGKLANEQFVARAPEAVVQTERDRLATARGRLEGLEQSLTEIG
ncbi:MAG: valine--tRNA ligase [Dehalococcoidia bacterium]|nr:valine--tRNA ligase [Dehalococcoidia bacterium]